MSEVTLTNRRVENLDELIRSMLATLRGYWTHAESYQRFAYLIAGFLVASGVVHTAVLLVDGGSWEGPVSWRKAITFGFSFGITTFSLAWVMNFLPKYRLRNWLLMGTLGVAMFVEVFLVTMQRWRGTASHFNFTTPFDAAVFSWMGVMIGFVGIVVLLMTLWSFFSLKTSSSMALAIRVGLVLLVISQTFGGITIGNGLQKVFEPETQKFVSSGIESASIFGTAGNMKVPHAVTLHAIQVLPLLAWLLFFTRRSESRRTKTTLMAAVGYIGLAVVIAIQTFSGLAPIDMGLLATLVFVLSTSMISTAFALAFIALRQTIS